MKNFGKLLKQEFINGRSFFDWAYILFGILLQVAAWVTAYKVNGELEAPVYMIAGMAGVIGTILFAQGKISAYIFGFINTLTYMFGCAWGVGFYAEFIEDWMYLITMCIGIFTWFKLYRQKSTNNSIEVKCKKFTWKGWVITGSIFVVGVIGFYFVLKYVPAIFNRPDPKPFLDSITTVPAFIGQILMILGFAENWVYWFILDVFSIVLWWPEAGTGFTGSFSMMAMYFFFTLNTVYGFYKWLKSSKSGDYQKIQ
jgi:nicotinamide mononucleotide transporter